jgi:hypothetical protein
LVDRGNLLHEPSFAGEPAASGAESLLSSHG